MSPKHTIYCLGEVLLALDADAPLAYAESFRPRLGGDAAVLAQACAAQGGRASLLASWERTHSGSGPPPRSPPRA